MRHETFLAGLRHDVIAYAEQEAHCRGHYATIHTVYRACLLITDKTDRAKVAKIAVDILNLTRRYPWESSVSKDIIQRLRSWGDCA